MAKEYEKEWPADMPKECPVNKGNYVMKEKSFTLPDYVPAGKYTVDILAVKNHREPDERQITCVAIKFTIRKSGDRSDGGFKFQVQRKY